MVLSFGPARVSPENIDLSSSSPSSSSSKRRPRVSMSPPSPAGGASSSCNRARRPPPPSPDDSDEDRITVHSPGGSSLDADSDDKTCFTDEHLLLMDPTPPSSPENEMTSNHGARKHEATTSSKGAASVVAPCTARPVSSLSLSSRVAAKMDSCLQRYTQYMATSLHQDRGLKLLQWTLWLASRLALLKTNHKQPQQQHGGGDMKNQVQYLSQCLRKLYLDCSFARYATRAFGLPTAIAAARTGSWGYQSSTTLTKYRRLHTVLGKLMALSMVGYYPTELVAYLQWMLPARPVKQVMPYSRSAERWSYWSCRFWLAYLVAETCQCLLVYKEFRDQEQDSQRQDGDDDDKNRKADRQSLMRYTKIQLLRDALFVLPCLNWSLPNWDIDPLLSENVVNGLSWLESIVCLYQ